MQRLKADKAGIEKAAEILNFGGVVVFPTETVYGIGASIQFPEAAERIYDIKQRTKDKPLQVLISSRSQLEELVCDIPCSAEKLMNEQWPGALTLIFKAPGAKTVGVRMPDHDIVRQLIDKCGPLSATSANISGDPAPVSADEVKIEADLLLDQGPCRIKKASAVIDTTKEPPVVLRQG